MSMLLRMLRAQLEANAWEEFRKTFLSIDTAELSHMGLRARWLLRDLDEPGSVFIVGLWESGAAVERLLDHVLVRGSKLRTFVNIAESHLCEIRSEWHAHQPAGAANNEAASDASTSQ
jgi:quinol monooxygenase YgiN